ncbi:MAG: hypothetical protein CYG59_26850, partial [Chloroflexi bacterium]
MTPLTSTLDVGALTHVGRRRADNQDSVLHVEAWSGALEPAALGKYGRLYLVADGVGGHDDGDVASRMVVDNVMAYFYTADPVLSNPINRLDDAIQRATADVYVEACRRRNNMASTLVAALITNEQLIVANVGDSPAFLIRRGEPAQKLTVDHLRREADGSQSLAQALGDPEVSVAFRTLPWRPGDTVVLGSDGLSDLVKPDEIKRVVGGSSARRATTELIQRANRYGGHDNISALVVRYGKLPLAAQTWFRQVVGAGLGVVLLCALLAWTLPALLADAAFNAAGKSTSGVSFTGMSIAVPRLNPTTGLTEMVQATITPTALPPAPTAPVPAVPSSSPLSPGVAQPAMAAKPPRAAQAPAPTPRVATTPLPGRTAVSVSAQATPTAQRVQAQPTARSTEHVPPPTARPTDAPPPTEQPRPAQVQVATPRPTDIPQAARPTEVPQAPAPQPTDVPQVPVVRPTDSPPPTTV